MNKIRLLAILGAVGSICSVVSFLLISLNVFPEKTQATVYFITQATLMFSLIGLATYVIILRERSLSSAQKDKDRCNNKLREKDSEISDIKSQLERIAPFALGYKELHLIFHDLRDALLRLNRPKADLEYLANEADDLVSRFVKDTIERVRTIFAETAEPDCRVCVKQVRENGKYVQTIFRDAQSQELHPDDLAPIEDNTDFISIFRKHEGYDRYFFCNDLLALGKNYHNSHKEWWKCYKSTIVWPIRGPLLDLPTKHHVVGFLCVDSLQTNVFDRKISVQIGAAVADMLYIILKRVDEIKKSAKQTERT